MAEGDGDGWAACERGHRHWGRHGAAGIVIGAPGEAERGRVLLVRRSLWAQHGGTWGPPGGARDSHERPAEAAVREAAEECAAPPGAARIHAMLTDDHGGWTYQTLIADAASAFGVHAASMESAEAAWVAVDAVGSLPLHPGFAAAWPAIRDALDPVVLIVDGANVMGARADGWWRDRAAATVRLHDELARLQARGLADLPVAAGAARSPESPSAIPVRQRRPRPAGRSPESGQASGPPPRITWFPRIVLVVEGASRAALERISPGPVEVVAAPGSGDDVIAELAGRFAGRRIAVTADRELRRRCAMAGSAVAGPRWLTGLL